jgi:hypothetical protein
MQATKYDYSITQPARRGTNSRRCIFPRACSTSWTPSGRRVKRLPIVRRAHEAGCDLHLEEPHLEPRRGNLHGVRPIGDTIDGIVGNGRIGIRQMKMETQRGKRHAVERFNAAIRRLKLVIPVQPLDSGTYCNIVGAHSRTLGSLSSLCKNGLAKGGASRTASMSSTAPSLRRSTRWSASTPAARADALSSTKSLQVCG